MLDAIVGAWCEARDLVDIQQRADAAGIGNARLNTVDDLAGHPQLAQRGRWRDVDTPVGPVPAVLPPALARGWTVPPARVPALGADTEAVRRELATESPAGGAASLRCRAFAAVTISSTHSAGGIRVLSSTRS